MIHCVVIVRSLDVGLMPWVIDLAMILRMSLCRSVSMDEEQSFRAGSR